MNLRSLIRQNLTDDEAWNVDDIAQRTIANVATASQAKELLAEALPYMVREVIKESRRSVSKPTPQNRSAKVAAIREQEQRRLSDARYPDANGIWRRIGSFNHDELLDLAERITQNAQRNLARAAAIRSLAGELTQAGVTTVDELDDADTLLAGAA